MAAAIVAAVTQLAGCASVRVDARTGSSSVPVGFTGGTVTTSQVQVSGGKGLGVAIVAGVLLVDGLRYLRFWSRDSSAPLSAPGDATLRSTTTRVNVQDCAQPVDIAAGNLRCR